MFNLFNSADKSTAPSGSNDPANSANSDTPGDPKAQGDDNSSSTNELTGLDRLQNLLDNKPEDKNSGNGTDNKDNTPFSPVALLNDAEALAGITDAIDFSASISPETQAKLADGSADAIQSLAQDMGKTAYQAALKHSSLLIENTIDDRLSRLEASTADQIKSSLTNHEIHKELPAQSNPMVQMAVSGFQQKLMQQNPTFTPDQVAKETRNYVESLAQVFNPDLGKNKDTANKASAPTDWADELGITW